MLFLFPFVVSFLLKGSTLTIIVIIIIIIIIIIIVVVVVVVKTKHLSRHKQKI